jgi:zinc and cadmium transporter
MDLSLILFIIIFTFLGSVVSLLGSFILLSRKLWQSELSTHLLAFAAGVLIATAFLDLLPEALHESDNNPNIFLAALLGIVLFFFLERVFISFHPHGDVEIDEIKDKSVINLVLLGDGLHNFIDGFVIAGGFFVSVEVGIITALAVAAHEIPQEISDFTILMRSGLKTSKALLMNALSGLTALIGAVLAMVFVETVELYLGLILGFTSGMFIYIAAVNLIPELQHTYLKDRSWHQSIYFVLGVLVVYLTVLFLHFEP